MTGWKDCAEIEHVPGTPGAFRANVPVQEGA